MKQFSNEIINKGFTLIEVLVVIAIIGILAGIIILGAAIGVRNKAKDSRIIAEMGQIRSVAGIYYNNNNYSFTGFDCTISLPDMSVLCNDINAQGGKKPSDDTPGVDIIANDQDYCAEVKLNSGKYWCVDSTGISKQYDSNPSCVGGGALDYTCE